MKSSYTLEDRTILPKEIKEKILLECVKRELSYWETIKLTERVVLEEALKIIRQYERMYKVGYSELKADLMQYLK